MKILDALQSVKRLAIETAPYIYYVENHPTYSKKMDAVFAFVEASEIEISTSVVALTETMTKPLQANDQALADAYSDLLTQNVRLIPITAAIAVSAALLRARYSIRTPDALHLASALQSGCDAFLTNDLGLKRVTDLSILILDDLILDEPEDTAHD